MPDIGATKAREVRHVTGWRGELYADYFQFYVQDDRPDVGGLSDAWALDSVQRLHIAVVPHAIGISTARNAMVPVEVAVFPTAPELDRAVWEHIVEADLVCTTGRLVIAGCTDFLADAPRIEVPRGRHRVRVLYRPSLTAAVSSDGQGVFLEYRVELWPSPVACSVQVVKQGAMPWAG